MRFSRLVLCASVMGALVGATVLFGVGAAQEQPQSAPAAPPSGAAAVRIVAPPAQPLASPAEISRLREGIGAADAGNWAGLRDARALSRDETVRNILLWRLASDAAAPLDFTEISSGLDRLQGWPGREGMRRRAELAVLTGGVGLSSAQQVEFLQRDGGPISGDGKIALARALRATGKDGEARTLAREAWRENVLSSRGESIASVDFASALTADDHAARVDRLLYQNERGAAQRILSKLSAENRLVANARMALQAPPRKGLQAIVDAVPAAKRDDPGLLWDRTRYIRRSGRPEEAAPIALRINPLAAAPGVRDAIFKERRLYVPRLIRQGQRREAYNLAVSHGLTSGEGFADSEFLAGWIALRFLRDATGAERHFTTLENGVGAPVSKARAFYWRGRALKALNRAPEAEAKFTQGAALGYTYYGQLSATELPTPPLLSFPDSAPITPAARAEFESRDVIRALRLMAEVGDQKDFESFAFYLDDQLQTQLEHDLLSLLARERAYTRTAVRSAKSGMRRGIVAPDAAYPLMDLPADARKAGRPEPALVLSITRQETEFDSRAVSSAGARGLMQLMPATARATARLEGLPYEARWLIEDPAYNVTLGAAHLEHLLGEWNGSYILTIAAYNAGPGNARRWIEENGDPRSAGVDPVDWVEMITFEETRNYVQRVLENVGVYRWRLANTPTPIRIQQDLRRGSY